MTTFPSRTAFKSNWTFWKRIHNISGWVPLRNWWIPTASGASNPCRRPRKAGISFGIPRISILPSCFGQGCCSDTEDTTHPVPWFSARTMNCSCGFTAGKPGIQLAGTPSAILGGPRILSPADLPAAHSGNEGAVPWVPGPGHFASRDVFLCDEASAGRSGSGFRSPFDQTLEEEETSADAKIRERQPSMRDAQQNRLEQYRDDLKGNPAMERRIRDYPPRGTTRWRPSANMYWRRPWEDLPCGFSTIP